MGSIAGLVGVARRGRLFCRQSGAAGAGGLTSGRMARRCPAPQRPGYRHPGEPRRRGHAVFHPRNRPYMRSWPRPLPVAKVAAPSAAPSSAGTGRRRTTVAHGPPVSTAACPSLYRASQVSNAVCPLKGDGTRPQIPTAPATARLAWQKPGPPGRAITCTIATVADVGARLTSPRKWESSRRHRAPSLAGSIGRGLRGRV